MGVESRLKNCFEAFKLNPDHFTLKVINQGLINDTFILYQEEEPTWILQRINTDVFTNPLGVMDNFEKGLSILNLKNNTYPKLLKTTEGNSFYRDENNHFWRISSFVAHSTAYEIAPSNEIAYEAGKLLAEFHSSFNPSDTPTFNEIIKGFNDLNYRVEQHQEAIEKGIAERKITAAKELEFAKNTYPLLTPLLSKGTLRVCHNDTKLNNMLFHKETNKGLCLIDLDTLMPGYFFYDFGDAYRTIANTAIEGDICLDNIQIDWEKSKHFIKGFLRHQEFMNKTDHESLVLGAVYMPFIHGLRALSDYLLGDVYYKVTHQGENLERAKSLLHFAELLLDNKERLQEQIESCLKTP